MAEMDMSARAPGGEEGVTDTVPYVICIKVDADNKISLSVEPPKPGEGMEPDGMPVPSVREAMSMVMDIIRAGGKMPDGSADDEFNKGFGKPQDGPMVDRMKYDDDNR